MNENNKEEKQVGKSTSRWDAIAIFVVVIGIVLGAVYFLWTGHAGWFFFFAVLSYMCRPTGLMILSFAGIATLLTQK